MAYQAQLWTALGDPMRLAIMERLVDGPLAVVELARELPISRPAVSQHLKVLKDAGLVIDQAEGNRRIYHVDPEALAELRARIHRFWERAMAAYKVVVEQAADEEDQ